LCLAIRGVMTAGRRTTTHAAWYSCLLSAVCCLSSTACYLRFCLSVYLPALLSVCCQVPLSNLRSLLSAFCRLLSFLCCSVPLFAVCCLLSAVCCLLSAVCCLLSVVCCLLSAVCCLLSLSTAARWMTKHLCTRLRVSTRATLATIASHATQPSRS
jgi:hypothetical protein